MGDNGVRMRKRRLIEDIIIRNMGRCFTPMHLCRIRANVCDNGGLIAFRLLWFRF